MFWRILVSIAIGEVLFCVLPLLMTGATLLRGWLFSN
jgi:hypothetical protein